MGTQQLLLFLLKKYDKSLAAEIDVTSKTSKYFPDNEFRLYKTPIYQSGTIYVFLKFLSTNLVYS